ncbi:hypothetical protein VPKG_00042 [Vibrio phage pYD21-A]|uniref:hypothetical protein n=1 Tax=Vibrio phage pYD21-A TaxID=754049 RepID=UPI0002C0B5B2|nr:hypothetical protein VPKG_00042 [Vibrio phage pYD21-A]AGH16079.1 hypothetical protein VPKG_00042 [Vibrio phage pYD21-A]
MIKFTCINQQHATIATNQLVERNIECIVLGRAVVADTEYTDDIIHIMSQAMGHSCDVSEFDIAALSNKNPS